MTSRKIPELLVPAGGVPQFKAGIENGANAIYVGGRLFNARANANNFDDDTMTEMLDYAHARGVKVFVTLNTLIRDDELEEALEYARFLYESGADGLIVQDLGLSALIRANMPDFPLHLSTQATVSDIDSVKAAADLGFERVVLSREMSLKEIREICEANICDIEIFVHGALCICYSGQCQMSRYFGGRSGNRGTCAQPCRLPYTALRADGTIDRGAGTHPLSPRDLCYLEDLPALIDAGVTSFKIEGRMKSPEYVAVVTGIYRKYIDQYLETGRMKVTAEDREALLQIFNRGSFTDSYLHGHSGGSMMSGTVPKNQGVKVGTVENVRRGSQLVDVRLRRGVTLSMGDGIEMHPSGSKVTSGGKLAGNIISYYKKLGGPLVRIGDMRGKITRGDEVFRTSSKAQLAEVDESFAKSHRKRTVDMKLVARQGAEGGSLVLTARTVPGPNDSHWKSQSTASASAESGPFEYSEEHRTPEERYQQSLRKTGSTTFEVRNIDMEGDFDMRVRASEINRLRRECLDRLEEAVRFRRQETKIIITADDLEGSGRVTNSSVPELFFYTTDRWREFRSSNEYQRILNESEGSLRVLLPLAELCTLEQDDDIFEEESFGVQIIPYISNVPRGRENEILMENYDRCLSICRGRGVSAGTLGWLKRLADEGIQVTADYGLNAYNDASAAVLMGMGAADVRPSLESAGRDSGSYPLMVTEHRFGFASIHGQKGHDAVITDRPYSSQSLITPYDAGGYERAARTYII